VTLALREPPTRTGASAHDYGPIVSAIRFLRARSLRLRWDDVDLDAAHLTVRHTLARVDGELVLLEPKTERSRRTIALPDVVVTALRGHRTQQKMERLVAGTSWVDSEHVFTTSRGAPLDAATVTRSFQRERR